MVLFVCHGNVARSQFAEALFRYRSEIEAASAGTHVPHDRRGNTLACDGETARNAAFRFKETTGIDISQSRRLAVSPGLVHRATKIIAITQRHNLPGYVLARSDDLEFWDVDDPHDMDAHGYQLIISTIAHRIDQMLPALERRAQGTTAAGRTGPPH